MYENGHPGFAFKNVILKFLFIVVLIFLVIWLFPTKGYVKNLIDQKLGTSVNGVFNTNIQAMKDAAISYYNGNRLPKNIGDSDKLTLKEMLDKNLLIEFKDSNNKKCDYKKSYVKVTKNKSDYNLKVNLTCSDKSASIKSYIGSYEYCTSDVCLKKKLKENKSTEENTNSSKEEISDNVQCEYVKVINGYYSNYGAWSNWTTNYVSKTNLREVETKVLRVQTGTVSEQSGTYKHTQSPKKVTGSRNGQQFIVYICPSDFDNGGQYNNPVTCIKTMPKYINKPIYQNITYYRYRDRTYIKGNNLYKWSSCNDDNLINQGYKATSKTK